MEEINSDRAKFHAMTEGTREDWGLIGAEFQRFASGLRIASLPISSCSRSTSAAFRLIASLCAANQRRGG
jgi:hypothetical protein